MLSRKESVSSLDLSNTRSNYEQTSLEEWLNKFGRIYGKRHDKHTTEYMISRLVEEVAELVSPMESRSELGPGLADVFSWTCSLAYKLNLDLADLAWKKYGQDPPSNKGESPSLASYSQPHTLKEWQVFVSSLYREENAGLSPMNALVALMKDVGDLAMLNRKRESSEKLTSKLAAILAWTLTLSQLLRIDLAQVVDEKYDDHCPVCLREICDTDVCHPLVNIFVSFAGGIGDEEKYTVLDTAEKLGFHSIINNVSELSSTKDLSTSFDLISRCDSACVVMSNQHSSGDQPDYKQMFEVLASYSMLSKGNVWIFAKSGSDNFKSYLERVFSREGIVVSNYSDSRHLKAILESELQKLLKKKTEIT
jgi:NTP pyrophosphatase (non-canonical NTP hydrolase)